MPQLVPRHSLFILHLPLLYIPFTVFLPSLQHRLTLYLSSLHLSSTNAGSIPSHLSLKLPFLICSIPFSCCDHNSYQSITILPFTFFLFFFLLFPDLHNLPRPFFPFIPFVSLSFIYFHITYYLHCPGKVVKMY